MGPGRQTGRISTKKGVQALFVLARKLLKSRPVALPKPPARPDPDPFAEFPSEQKSPVEKPKVDKNADYLSEFPDESELANRERRQLPRRATSKLFEIISSD